MQEPYLAIFPRGDNTWSWSIPIARSRDFFRKSRHYLIWVWYENCIDFSTRKSIKIANCWFSPHSLVICMCNLAKTSGDSELAGERHA